MRIPPVLASAEDLRRSPTAPINFAPTYPPGGNQPRQVGRTSRRTGYRSGVSSELDPALIERAVAGDRDALERCLHAAMPELRAGISIQPVWRRSLDPDDLLQVSSLEAFLRIQSLQTPTPVAFRTWLKRIVANNLRDAVRGLERHKRADLRLRVTRGPEGQSARTLLGQLAASTSTASTPAILAEDVELLQACLKQLPASYRQVVQRMDLDEVDAPTVAEEMGRSRGAIYLLRSRAHDRLRELLTKNP